MSAILRFADLLRLAFQESRVNWVAGKDQVEQAVLWVSTDPREARPGDALLLPALGADIEQIQQAQEKGVVGVILSGSTSFDDAYGKLRIPVVALDEQEDLRSTQRLLLVLLVNQRLGLVERGYRIHTQLAQLSAEGVGLGGLVEAMVDISGRGVLVQDKRGYILAEQSSPVLEGIWQDVLIHLSTLSSLPDTLQDRKLAGKQDAPVLQSISEGLVRLVSPINVGNVARGYLSLVSLPEEIDELDQLVAEQGKVVCAIEMSRSKAVREMEKRLQGDLLTALLRDEFSPRDAGLWADTMGLNLDLAHVALRFAWEKPVSPSRRRLETMIHGEVTRLGLTIIISAIGAEIVCFCEVPIDMSRPDSAIKLGERVLEQGMREFPDSPVLCGIGTPALVLNEWNTSFRQAGQALEMARRLDARQPLYFPDLSIYRLLLQIEHNPELVAFQEEMLGPLLAQEASQELLHTLESYFAHNGNITQTAEELFIHRNTLQYRLERIAAILNRDLDKPETRLGLQLALYINRMRSSHT